MKKICLVIPSLQAGGMERVMSQLASFFSSKKQIEVHLVLYGINREVFYSIPKTIVIHRPDFEFSNKHRTGHTIRTILFLRKSIKAIQPDHILSFGEMWNNLVLLALIGLNYPVFISDRSRPDKNLGSVHSFLKNWLYPKAAGMIAQTERAKEIALFKKLNNNIRVIGNPIRFITPGPSQEKESVVLTVGRLIRTKNLDQLIRLFVRIGQPGWKLVIVGGDAQKQNLMPSLKQLVVDLDAGDRVVLAGPRADVDHYYQRSKIFAFTSSSEGFPNVVGEAMSAGLPVVSFDCVAGPSEMIQDGENGFLVPVFDYPSFEQKLKCLMENENLREKLGSNARRSIKRFSVESIGEQFCSFILNQ